MISERETICGTIAHKTGTSANGIQWNLILGRARHDLIVLSWLHLLRSHESGRIFAFHLWNIDISCRTQTSVFSR